MKILFLSISYKVEAKNIYTDIVEELVKNNHSVTIVSESAESIAINSNYRIIGFNNSITGKKNLIKKGIDTVLIGSKFKKSIKELLNNESFDLVLYATPPITLNSTVKYAKKKYEAKTYLMLKDIFPQNAVDLEMFSKVNPIYWYFRYKEKQLYNISDYIGCMSNGNIEYLFKHNSYIDKSKVGLFCNAIKIKENYVLKQSESETTTFIFGGNLGKPQNIPGLLKIIDQLKNYSLSKFLIVGKGADDSLIKDYLKSHVINNLEYHEFLPKEEYDQLLEKADVGLISLDPRFTIPNIPSKLPSYMNLRKSVLAITDTNTDLKNIIQESQCGWWNNAEDIEGIIKTIKYICEHKKEQVFRGNNGYEYLCENYDVKINVKQLELFMEE